MQKKRILIFGSIILILVIVFIIVIYLLFKEDANLEEQTIKTNNNIHYLNGVYDIILDDIEMDYNTGGVISLYQDLLLLKEKYEWNDFDNLPTAGDFDKNNYLYYILKIDDSSKEMIVDNLEIKNNEAIITFNITNRCYRNYNYVLYLIPIEKSLDTEINNFNIKYNDYQEKDCDVNWVMKPILYLYPKEKTNITVKLAHPENLITTYPKYNDGWQVTASPNGDLYDKDNKYYYALYWDEKNTTDVSFDEGFYVEKESAINFLEEKLSIIGLNDKERNEFIMYWLPKLEDNEKSLVYFELTEERESNNKLIINPKPDSMLRINIHIKKVSKKINIKEQYLPTFTRTGFTVVEWGGTIHK